MLEKRIIHYGISGFSAFIIEYGSFLILYYALKLPVVLSNTLSFILGLITSFTLNKNWVFGHTVHTRTFYNQFLVYLSVAVVNLMVTNLAIHILAKYIPAFVAKILLVLIVACWNFVIFKKIIFKSDEQNGR